MSGSSAPVPRSDVFTCRRMRQRPAPRPRDNARAAAELGTRKIWPSSSKVSSAVRIGRGERTPLSPSLDGGGPEVGAEEPRAQQLLQVSPTLQPEPSCVPQLGGSLSSDFPPSLPPSLLLLVFRQTRSSPLPCGSAPAAPPPRVALATANESASRLTSLASPRLHRSHGSQEGAAKERSAEIRGTGMGRASYLSGGLGRLLLAPLCELPSPLPFPPPFLFRDTSHLPLNPPDLIPPPPAHEAPAEAG